MNGQIINFNVKRLLGRVAFAIGIVLLLCAFVLARTAAGSTVEVSAGELVYSAATGEENDVTISLVGSNFEVSDSGAILVAASGCNEVSANVSVCSATGVTAVSVAGGDEDDLLRSTSSVPASIFGGTGNDTLTGGAGDDALSGGDGVDRVDYSTSSAGVSVNLWMTTSQDTGGAGVDAVSGVEGVIGSNYNDMLLGNASDNEIDGGAGNDNIYPDYGADTVSGGSGSDNVNYAWRSAAVTVSLDGVADDGSTGEGDNVLADVEKISGGSGNDTLIGNANNNTLNGGTGGDDVLIGNGGDDWIIGGSGIDTASYSTAGSGVSVSLLATGYQATGGAGSDLIQSVENLTGSDQDDTLIGNASNNVLSGGAGNDTLSGGAGNDTIVGGFGIDQIEAGDGDDVVNSADDLTEDVDCGAGADVATVDDSDNPDSNCEVTIVAVNTTITGGVEENELVATATATVEFESNVGVSFECRVDDEPWEECISPFETPTLSNGPHSIDIRAIDASNIVEETPARRWFAIDVIEDSGSVMSDDPRATSRYDIPINEHMGAQVELATGNLIVGSRDQFADAAHSFGGYDRYYTSQTNDRPQVGLGEHWSLSLGPDVYVKLIDTDSVELHGPGGYVARMIENDEGGYDGPGSFTDEFRDVEGGGYELTRGSGDAFRFDESGILTEFIGRDGTSHEVAFANGVGDAPQLLERIGPAGDPLFSVGADSSGRIVDITDHILESEDEFSFTSGRLTAIDGRTLDATYEYDENGYLETIESTGGVNVEIDSDSDGKLASITVDDGVDAPAHYEFDYATGTTTVTDPAAEEHVFTVAANGESFEDPFIEQQLVSDLINNEGVTESEAIERLKLENRLAGLEDFLIDELEDAFVSFGQDPAGGISRLNVEGTADVEAAETAVEKFGVSDLVEVVVAPMALEVFDAELDALDEDLAPLVTNGQAELVGDEVEMTANIETTNDLTEAEEDLIDDAVLSSALQVTVEQSDIDDLAGEEVVRSFEGCRTFNVSVIPLSIGGRALGCKSPMRGAMSLILENSQSRGLCSTGFGAKNGSGDRFVFTAGHCVHAMDDAFAYSTPNWTDLHKEEIGSIHGTYQYGSNHGSKGIDAGAVQVHYSSYWKKKVKPWVALIDSNNYNPRYAINRRGVARRGQQVCVIRTRGKHRCGKIVSSRVSSHRSTDGTIFRNHAVADICGVSKGDSGGPVVRGNRAIGIVSVVNPGFYGTRCKVFFARILTSLKASKQHLGSSVENSLDLTTLTTHSTSARPALARLPKVTSQPATVQAAGDSSVFPSYENLPTFSVNPNGLATTYRFEFRGYSTYHQIPEPSSAGGGTAQVAIDGSALPCLVTPGEVRIVASNRSGDVRSEWQETFPNCFIQ